MEEIKKTDFNLSFRGAVKTLSGSNYAANILQYFYFRNTFEENNLNL